MRKLHITDTSKFISEYRKRILEKIPSDLLQAEHTDTHHFYRYKPTDELMISCTAPLNIISNDHLKSWAAKITAEFLVKNWEHFDDKKELIKMATKEHYRIFKDAGDVGTKIHDVVEKYCKEWIKTGNKPVDIKTFILGEESDGRVFAGARSFEYYMDETGAIPVFAELIVANPKIGVAGQLDLILLVPSKGKDMWELILTDVKTSNHMDHDTYALQTANYYDSFVYLTGEKLHRVNILLLDKDKMKYTIGVVPHIKSSVAIYKHALAIYRWKLDNDRKKVVKKKNRIKIEI